jgi:hypothetical protein
VPFTVLGWTATSLRRPAVRPAASPRYTRPVTRTYVAVVVVEVVVLAALWFLSLHFAA